MASFHLYWSVYSVAATATPSMRQPLSAVKLPHLPLVMALALAPCGMSLAAEAKALPEIEYATPEQSVWTTRTNSRGEPDNPLFRVAAALFARAGIPWHGRSYPAARLFTYLQDGTTQFSMLVRSPALQECCLLSGKPVTHVEIRVYHRAGTPPVEGPGALAGKKIITIRGYSYGGLLEPLGEGSNPVTNNVAPSHSSAFTMLAQQRADYVIDYAGPAAEVLAAAPLPGLRWEVLSRREVYLVLAKSYPDATGVMARLEAIVETLDIDGLMRETRK